MNPRSRSAIRTPYETAWLGLVFRDQEKKGVTLRDPLHSPRAFNVRVIILSVPFKISTSRSMSLS
jgi:hypothetical protein